MTEGRDGDRGGKEDVGHWEGTGGGQIAPQGGASGRQLVEHLKSLSLITDGGRVENDAGVVHKQPQGRVPSGDGEGKQRNITRAAPEGLKLGEGGEEASERTSTAKWWRRGVFVGPWLEKTNRTRYRFGASVCKRTRKHTHTIRLSPWEAW